MKLFIVASQFIGMIFKRKGNEKNFSCSQFLNITSVDCFFFTFSRIS
uniref:Uncharacterized protein n=1 Tax=Rhizophora mucronata TaxID=61149 RepID=A0A2P2NK53_RHIMU